MSEEDHEMTIAADDRGPVAHSIRSPVTEARRIVLKVGTRVLMHDDGSPALARLFQVVETAARLRKEGRDVLLVTSGAVGLGRLALRLDGPPGTAELGQMCAAVGQSRLMELYQQGFARLGVICAQILITWTDFDDPLRYRNLHETLQNLLEAGVVPVINENDAISLNDRAYLGTGKRPIFDDNDRLSALVASELAADVLIMLTDVPGVMTADPRRDPQALRIDRIEDPYLHGADVSLATTVSAGRGGMSSKLEAAAVAARGGCHTVIASGVDPGALGRVLAGDTEGTWIPAGEALSPRSRWIAYCSHPKGRLILSMEGAESVAHTSDALTAGAVESVDGSFRRGDVVELVAPDGKVVGRGIVAVESQFVGRWIAKPPGQGRNKRVLVDREHLVLKGQHDV
jgi:glutamate 5-kinase